MTISQQQPPEVDWDKLVRSDEYARFDQIGDEVSGTLLEVGQRTFNADEGPVPQLKIRTDSGAVVTVTCGQTHLQQLLARQRPQLGDWNRIVLDAFQKRDGGKKKKLFTLEVKRAEAKQEVEPEEEDPPF
jgi:hypothetical protein